MTNIKSTINANGVEIRITSSKEADYISLTDIAKKGKIFFNILRTNIFREIGKTDK